VVPGLSDKAARLEAEIIHSGEAQRVVYVLAWSGGRIESDPKVSGVFREQQPILRTGPLSERTTCEGPAYTT
jgi:hypothetical protein